MQLTPRLPAADLPAPRSSKVAVSLWLGSVVLAVLFVLLLSVFEALQGDVSRLQHSLATALASRVAPVPEENLAALRLAASELTSAEEDLRTALFQSQHARVPWLPLLQQVVPVPPAEVELTALVQESGTLTIRGRAANSAALSSYVARLRGSSLFRDVRVDAAADSFAVTVVLNGSTP